ncbi:MAG: dTDP-glucose 4,6-dehydratase [Nitrospinota bacterium]|nr:dTDP-glucose 4,6-dehydratase [Nitrospinota bacterium]
MSKHTLLVTGGAGFIGGNFVLDQVTGGKTRVVNLDLLTYAGNMATLAQVVDNPDHIFVHGDIRDRELVLSLMKKHDVSAIVNFAAESHVDRSIDAPVDFIQTNIVGTFELLEASRAYLEGLPPARREAFRFLHVSTDEIFGSLGETGKFTESTPYAPNSPYSASKAASDHLARAYHHTYGMPTIITNCSNNYGPHQFPEKLIPLVIMKGLSGEAVPVYGDGKNVRDWLYVMDHCEALEAVLEKGRPGQTYNVGGNSEKTNMEVVTRILDTLDELAPDSRIGPRTGLITHVADRPGHDRRYAIDAGKIQRELGWRPRETFDTGLRKTVRWYIENRQWVDKVTADKYRGQRLGLG